MANENLSLVKALMYGIPEMVFILRVEEKNNLYVSF